MSLSKAVIKLPQTDEGEQLSQVAQAAMIFADRLKELFDTHTQYPGDGIDLYAPIILPMINRILAGRQLPLAMQRQTTKESWKPRKAKRK